MKCRKWEDADKELYTSEEIMESDLRVAIVGALIDARNEQGITQKQLEEMTGISQVVISRLESGTTMPKIDTIQKLLAPLGKTLAVVPMQL